MTFKQYNRTLNGARAETANTEAFGRSRHTLTPTPVAQLEAKEIIQKEGVVPDRQAAFEEAKRKEEEAAAQAAAAAAAAAEPEVELLPSARAPSAEDPAGQRSRVSAEQQEKDFNAVLMADPSWGRNPVEPPEPIKALPIKRELKRLPSPSKRSRMRKYAELHLAPLSPGKDKPLSPRMRQRLPPPLFPKTTGHGFKRGPDEVSLLEGSMSMSLSMRELDASEGASLGHSLRVKSNSPRKTGFFPVLDKPAKVQTTDKMKLYFGQA